MSEYLGGDPSRSGSNDEAARAARLKVIVDRLASGARPADVKREFHELIKGADAAEVAALEQALIESGTPVEEVQRLCEVHADVFRSGLERGAREERMPGHPVHTFQAENREAKKRLRALSFSSLRSLLSLRQAIAELKAIITHYERKENQLFPYLEKTGFTGPSKVMWGKHDEIREVFRALDQAFADADLRRVRALARDLSKRMRMMIFMEERILFPNALKRLSAVDWAAIRRGEDAIGFAWVKPGAEWDPALAGAAPVVAAPAAAAPVAAGAGAGAGGSGARASGLYKNFEAAIARKAAGADAPAPATDPGIPGAGGTISRDSSIPLSEGALPLDVLDRILTMLPLDLSFVDAEDRVRYYSDSPHRVFPRSPAIIGREVQNCHPPKSVHIVEQILAAFKAGEKDSADFWIEMGGRFIHISYKAVRDDAGAYLGCLEMSMDATDLRALTGQRRLLDW